MSQKYTFTMEGKAATKQDIANAVLENGSVEFSTEPEVIGYPSTDPEIASIAGIIMVNTMKPVTSTQEGKKITMTKT